MKTLILLTLSTLFVITCAKSPTLLTDIDGNVYQIVKIGDQWWMAENLKVTHYRNGDAIPTGHSVSEWSTLSSGAYAVYNNDESNSEIYGYLYNWYAVDDSRNIAPKNWHIPTDDEWKTLVNYLGGKKVAGGILKETGTTHWSSPNNGATNQNGFTALPGGYRVLHDGKYYSLGLDCSFWSSTEHDSSNARGLILGGSNSKVRQNYFDKAYGYSIRCVRD